MRQFILLGQARKGGKHAVILDANTPYEAIDKKYQQLAAPAVNDDFSSIQIAELVPYKTRRGFLTSDEGKAQMAAQKQAAEDAKKAADERIKARKDKAAAEKKAAEERAAAKAARRRGVVLQPSSHAPSMRNKTTGPKAASAERRKELLALDQGELLKRVTELVDAGKLEAPKKTSKNALVEALLSVPAEAPPAE